MDFLYQKIQQDVAAWREDGYPFDEHPAIAEILDYATLPESDTRRFLRKAQLRALRPTGIYVSSRARPTSSLSTAATTQV